MDIFVHVIGSFFSTADASATAPIRHARKRKTVTNAVDAVIATVVLASASQDGMAQIAPARSERKIA